MKTFITMLVAAAVSLAVVRAADQESVGEKTSDALETTKEKTKEAGRAVVHTTKKAANAVADALTPEAGARQIKVKLTEYAIDIPTRIEGGRTAFIVYNAGNKKHNFEVQGQGVDKKFIAAVDPGKTKVLHVDLKSGTYKVYCPIDNHAKKGMSRTLTVR